MSQLHWGGGTPTYLNKAQISRLMKLLRENFQFNADAEISIEVDPREIELMYSIIYAPKALIG